MKHDFLNFRASEPNFCDLPDFVMILKHQHIESFWGNLSRCSTYIGWVYQIFTWRWFFMIIVQISQS